MFVEIKNENDKNKITDKNFCLEIEKLNKKIFENNFVSEDHKKNIDIYIENKNNKININLKENIIEEIKKLNIEYNNNIEIIKKKFNQLIEKKTIIQQKKDKITKKKCIYEDIEKEDIEKKKIYIEFKQKTKNLDSEYKKNLEKLIIIENKSLSENKKIEKDFFQKKEEISKKNNEETKKINNFFYKKFFFINEKINILKKNYKNDINNIQNYYKEKIETIEKIEQKKEENILQQNNTNINNIFEKELKNHNQILLQQQNKFIIKKENLKKEKNSLFEQEKLKIFFIFDKINKINYINFLSFLNKIINNEFLNIQKIFSWRKKYIFIKFLYNKKINLISIEKNFITKKIKKKIENNIILEKKEKKILKNNLLQKLNYLELELRILEINKKYEIIEINSEKDIKKQEIQFLFEKNKILEKIKLKNLSIQKKKIFLTNEKNKKNALLKMQIQIKKINLKSYYFQNIIKNQEKIEELENNIINIKNNQEYQFQKQKIILEKNKQDFLKRNKLKKIHFQYLKQKYFENQEKNLYSLNIFEKYIKETKIKEKKIFQKIKFKLNSYFQILKCQKKVFSIIQFSFIHQLFDNFIDNNKEKQFHNYYLFLQQIYFFNKNNLQIKINLNKNLIEYYRQNIFVLKNIINQNKIYSNFNKNNLFFSIEKKFKKYENFYIIFKKKYLKLKHKEKKNEINFQNKVIKLKKEQNKKIQKNNFYQKKIFSYLEKIENFKKKKTLGTKIFLLFYKVKFFYYWNKLLKNIKYFYPKINLNKLLEKIIKNKDENNKLEKYEEKINCISYLYDNILEEIYNFQIQNIKNKTKQKKIDLINKIKKIKLTSENKLKIMKDQMFLLQLNLKEAQEINQNDFLYQMKKIKQKKKEEEIDILSILNKKNQIYTKTIFIESQKIKINKKLKEKEKNKILENFNFMKKIYCKNEKKITKKIKKINKNNLKKISFLSKTKKIYFWYSNLLNWWKYIKEKQDLKKNIKNQKIKIKKKIQKNIFLYKNFFNFFK
ncbi:hypothetical protein [Candidatus Phytoplasma oryzae]|nr:hypothetical protein PIE28_00865 [Candidatus Phytoplasma oryzae]